MTNTVFVGNLDYSITDTQLEEYFSTIGKVVSAKVIIDRYTGQGKGFGFVQMIAPKEAKNAMDTLNGTQLAGRSIVVKEAKPQEDRNQDQNRRNDRW